MPYGPSSDAHVFVRPSNAHLAAAYGLRRGEPKSPETDDMLTMAPVPAFLRCGAAARVLRKAPSRFPLIQARQSRYVSSSTGTVGPLGPALFTRTSSPPSRSTASPNNLSMSSSDPTSAKVAVIPGTSSWAAAQCAGIDVAYMHSGAGLDEPLGHRAADPGCRTRYDNPRTRQPHHSKPSCVAPVTEDARERLVRSSRRQPTSRRRRAVPPR